MPLPQIGNNLQRARLVSLVAYRPYVGAERPVCRVWQNSTRSRMCRAIFAVCTVCNTTRRPELMHAQLMVYASYTYSCRVQCYNSGVRNDRLEKKTHGCTCHTLQIGRASKQSLTFLKLWFLQGFSNHVTLTRSQRRANKHLPFASFLRWSRLRVQIFLVRAKQCFEIPRLQTSALRGY